MGDPLKWFDDTSDHPKWIEALAEVRHLAAREAWCYQHVQAVIVAIDRYAQAAFANRDFFLKKNPRHRPQKQTGRQLMTDPAQSKAKATEVDDLEVAVDQAIAACDGDTRATIRGLIIANNFLEDEVCELMQAVSHAYVRGRFHTYNG